MRPDLETSVGLAAACLVIGAWLHWFYMPPFPTNIRHVKLDEAYLISKDWAMEIQHITLLGNHNGDIVSEPYGIVCGRMYVKINRFWMKREYDCSNFEKIVEFDTRVNLKELVFL